MRPRLPENKKRNKPLIIRVSDEEKVRIKSNARIGRYMGMSDFIRARLLSSNKKVVSLDEAAATQIKRMDYELNKIGVNLNQLAKRINIHDIYQFTTADREVFRQVLQELKNCFSVLQKYIDRIDSER